MEKESPSRRTESSENGCLAWLKGPTAALYAAYFLSSWGDRMWHFAVGIYLVFFDGNTLRLAATYGFISSGCILLFGGVIGDWVDKNRRIKVVRVSLFVQNVTVALSAAAVATLLKIHISNQSAYRTVEACIIIFALIAVLASCAFKISIEKDWIVEVASGNRDTLAQLNAVTRTVDLACKALSPLIVGQIMTYGSRFDGAIFIMCWNICSVVIEYMLLRRVYHLVPSLANKMGVDSPFPEKQPERDPKAEAEKLVSRAEKSLPSTPSEPEPESQEKHALKDPETVSERHKEKPRVWRMIFSPCIKLYTGWSVYMRQRILLTGLSLAALYMTVLGFDSITIGYIYSQGVTESILGICCGLAAVTGIIGTFLYTQLQKCFGLNGTGIISFAVEVTFLMLSLISIWTPGSPFYLYDATAGNCSFTTSHSTPNTDMSQLFLNITTHSPLVADPNMTEFRYRRDLSYLMDFTSAQGESDTFTGSLYNHFTLDTQFMPVMHSLERYRRNVSENRTSVDVPYKVVTPSNNQPEKLPKIDTNPCDPSQRPQTSVILFLIGIIASRIGLWMADLTVTQLYQEEVVENERGTVGGVQSSLNMLLDMLKFIAVIFLPQIHTFGFLVIMSFCFITIGLILFTTHVLRESKCKQRSEDPTPINDDYQPNIIYKPNDSAFKV